MRRPLFELVGEDALAEAESRLTRGAQLSGIALDGPTVSALVHDRQVLAVTIRLSSLELDDDGDLSADGMMSVCPCNQRDCWHRAAVLLKAADLLVRREEISRTRHEEAVVGKTEPPAFAFPDDGRSPGKADAVAEHWLRLAQQSMAASQDRPQALIYLLCFDRQGRLAVRVASARRKKNGVWSNPEDRHDLDRILHSAPKYLGPDDSPILHELLRLRDNVYWSEPVAIQGAASGGSVLEAMIATGRCYDQRSGDHVAAGAPSLTWGGEREATVAWVEHKSLQRLVFSNVDGKPLTVLPVQPPCWMEGGTVGPLRSALPHRLAALAATMPPLPADLVPAAARTFAAHVAPPTLASTNEPPHACLDVWWGVYEGWVHALGRRTRRRVRLVTAYFRYRGIPVRPGSPLMRVGGEDGPLRDRETEARLLDGLKDAGLIPTGRYDHYHFVGAKPRLLEHTWIGEGLDREAGGMSPLDIPRQTFARLAAQGWRVEGVELPPPVDVDGWFARVEDGADGEDQTPDGRTDWFRLQLGLEIGGEKVDLSAAVAQAIAGGPEAIALLPRSLVDGVERVLVEADGKLLRLRRDDLERLSRALLELIDRPRKDGVWTLGTQDLALVADLAELSPRWLGGDKLRALAERLKTLTKPEDLDPPPAFAATLRPYQRTGLGWLARLAELGAGGLLADDMGLGKTVQALAHLARERAAGRLDKPALVVAPRSVTTNWLREAQRFLPELKTVLWHGPERHDEKLDDRELIVTTYATLMRDQERFQAMRFRVLMCDEAQAIKNAGAKAALAIRGLRADHRVALTGTPVENHLGELWAQMHWLNPGLLGDHTRFDRHFRKPIEKDGDQQRLELLRRRVAPFLLRRTKSGVATELPPKTEQIVAVELSADERVLYEGIRVSLDRKVREALNERGLAQSQIIVLDALLKLRQCCCHPHLIKTPLALRTHEASKLDALADLLPTLVEDGRRILVFSQFTTMLDLIRARLDELGLKYGLLTGETRDRQTEIDRFQRGEVPVFLLSLKAGGVGLNLTAADAVVLYDPWWNPAVEDQAIDRTHRIGQDKPVFVYRLVVEGSVEERMVELQKRKRNLAGAMYGDDGQLGGTLSEDDVAALLAPLV